MAIWTSIASAITQATGHRFKCDKQTSVGGGCINSCYNIYDGSRSYFVKINSASCLDMFEAEAAGLNEIAASQSIHVPEVICYGSANKQAYLILERLTLTRGSTSSAEQLGRKLARMHRHTAKRFGWFRDNTIGSTLQINSQTDDWLNFWREQRLGFQLRLAAEKGYVGRLQRLGHQVIDNLELLLSDHRPEASLLHGDLWSGNYATCNDGSPVIFDPAVYYGDRETDLAMTELFGGFPPAFYHAYEEEYPLDSGYERRKTLYNVYHIINHVNLFGSGYLGQAEAMLNQLIQSI